MRAVSVLPAGSWDDLDEIESHLSREGLQTILIDQLAVVDAENAATVIEKEGYSTLFRTLALLLALAAGIAGMFGAFLDKAAPVR